MYINLQSPQQGIGLVEVLVSLLLLAVAILGFSAMQLKAVKSTDESMLRNQALTTMRGASEMMRANSPDYREQFQTTLKELSSENDIGELKKKFEGASGDGGVKNKCTGKGTDGKIKFCSQEDLAEKDATIVVYQARKKEIKISMIDCPAQSTARVKSCFITSWGNTNPTVTTTTDTTSETDCINKNGKYHLGATCFVMEAY